MVEEFKKHITENTLIKEKDKILLAVSGGVDSMVMLYLFVQSGYTIGIAHCNFKLRGKEADIDQIFVRDTAQSLNIEFFTTNFDTLDYSDTRKISVQMAARELRYNWFEQLAQKKKYDKIATAHNLNDVAETFFINLTRGSGIKGFTGIPLINGKIIRPLLFASRDRIANYAYKNKINYREDSSNSETKYLRNAIRHKIIPEFENLTKNFLSALQLSTKLLNETCKVYYKQIEIYKKLLFEIDGSEIKISIPKLKQSNITEEILFELLNDYSFTFDSCSKLLKNIDNQPGKVYSSPTHNIIKDREYIYISNYKEIEQVEYVIKNLNDTNQLPIKLFISKTSWGSGNTLIKSKARVIFDAKFIQFPLILRKWRTGDYFYPFGMKGRKKLSDYFSDNKFSLIDKQKVWILTCREEIIWIIGHRTSNKFKVTNNTEEVIQFELNS